MFLLEVPDLMGEHRFQFGFGQLLEQSIKQHNFPEPAKPGKERVGMARSFAAIHDLDAARAETSALSQGQQPLAQASFGQRREFVK